MIGVINCGRLTIGLFHYWIGFSWRYLNAMGRICDCGFVKFVWHPRRSGISAREDHK